MPAKRVKASATVTRSGAANGSASAPAKTQLPHARDLRGLLQKRHAIRHQGRIRLAGAIPFDHREFGMVQRAALAIAKHFGEFDDAPFARGQQFLAGEFRRSTQIKRRRTTVRRPECGREGMQMRLVARRDLQRPGLDLDKVIAGKPGPQRHHDPAPRQQDRPAVGVNMRGPKGRGIGRFLGHSPCL